MFMRRLLILLLFSLFLFGSVCPPPLFAVDKSADSENGRYWPVISYDGSGNITRIRGLTTYSVIKLSDFSTGASLNILGATRNPTGVAAVGIHLYNPSDTVTATTWQIGSFPGQPLIDTTTVSASNITTNASTVVKATAGKFGRVNVNVVGTTSTLALYNDASAPCDTNYVLTLSTAALGQVELNHTFSSGICALTAGAAAADITILYR